MSSRYCKQCKVNVQEQHLYEGERCPLCGTNLPKPAEFKLGSRKVAVPQLYDISVELTNGKKGEIKGVTSEQINKMEAATNVVSWYVVRQYSNTNSN